MGLFEDMGACLNPASVDIWQFQDMNLNQQYDRCIELFGCDCTAVSLCREIRTQLEQKRDDMSRDPASETMRDIIFLTELRQIALTARGDV